MPMACWTWTKRVAIVGSAFGALIMATANPAFAEIQIVALGASDTAGKGVGSQAAWPSQLEGMLRSRGYDVRVSNAGISGDDTGRMRARLNSVISSSTRLVILEKAATNDRRRGVNTGGNVSAIVGELRARRIKTIIVPGMHGWANHQIQADGIHITERGHTAVASRLLPQVIAAIGKRSK